MTLNVYTGDDKIWQVQVFRDGAPMDLTGMVAATFLVKTSVDDADSAALITKTLAGGIGIVSLVGGQLTVRLDAADTVLRPGCSLVCCLKLKDVAGKTHTVYSDDLSIVRPATRVAV